MNEAGRGGDRRPATTTPRARQETTMKKLIAKVGNNVRVYRDAEWDEYVVCLKGFPAGDYHTDDKQDALDTAAHVDASDQKRLAQLAVEQMPTRNNSEIGAMLSAAYVLDGAK